MYKKINGRLLSFNGVYHDIIDERINYLKLQIYVLNNKKIKYYKYKKIFDIETYVRVNFLLGSLEHSSISSRESCPAKIGL